MIRTITLLSALLLFSLNVEAVSSSTVDRYDCSGSLSVSLLDTAALSCGGNFSLSGGRIVSDSGIVITSSGSLFLDDLAISAPFVEISSDHIIVGNGVSIYGNSLSLWTTSDEFRPVIASSPGATISIGSGTVPRPIDSSGIHQLVGSGTIVTFVGGDISLAAPVPEPSSYASMLLGLSVLLGVTKRGKATRGRRTTAG